MRGDFLPNLNRQLSLLDSSATLRWLAGDFMEYFKPE